MWCMVACAQCERLSKLCSPPGVQSYQNDTIKAFFIAVNTNKDNAKVALASSDTLEKLEFNLTRSDDTCCLT